MMTAYLECLQKERITAQQNVSLKNLCSFQIGGNARILVSPDTTEALCRAVTLAVELGIRFVVIGNGTNLLFADEGFDGAIIRTSHLKGLKIGIMGCIVNGPGEMADADYGYVGAGRGKVSLYKKKECIEKNIPEEQAVEKLIELIRSNGDYIEK